MDDLINRQAAIELCDWYEHEFSECDHIIRLITEDLKSFPPAEPERQKGKWRITLDNDEKMYECSVCKCRMIKEPYDLAVGMHGYNYCPYCGAKMEDRDE